MTRNTVLLLSIFSLLIWGCGPSERTETTGKSAETAVEQEEAVRDVDMGKPEYTEEEMRDICISNQRVCEGAVAIYTKVNDGNPPEKLEDVVGEYLEEVPECPKGGEYIIDTDNLGVTCSLQEHQRVEE